MKRVTSPAPIEKPCQLMIEPGELVTLSVRASGRCIVTAPLTICGPVGFARAEVAAKQQLTATAIGRARNRPLFMRPPSFSARVQRGPVAASRLHRVSRQKQVETAPYRIDTGLTVAVLTSASA